MRDRISKSWRDSYRASVAGRLLALLREAER